MNWFEETFAFNEQNDYQPVYILKKNEGRHIISVEERCPGNESKTWK